MHTLTTDGIRTTDRAEFWADLVSRYVTPVAVVPSPTELHGCIEARAAGDVAVARVSGRGLRALHDEVQVARTDHHRYVAGVHLGGAATIVTGGETIALRPGDLFVTDTRHRFSLGLEQPWRHLVLSLPSGMLDARLARPGRVAGHVVRDGPLVRFWRRHLAAGFVALGDVSAASAALFAGQSLDLLAHVLEASREAGGHDAGVTRAAAFSGARQVIAARFWQPGLSPATIAANVGVSSRTLARAFAERGETVMQRIWWERVGQAARRLASPAWAHRSITDIAFASGFADLSHFGRVFAAQTGLTPSRYRAQGDVDAVPRERHRQTS